MTAVDGEHMAESVRFELTEPFGSPVFKTGALNHSASSPQPSLGQPRYRRKAAEKRSHVQVESQIALAKSPAFDRIAFA
jgi:hypothetical protein